MITLLRHTLCVCLFLSGTGRLFAQDFFTALEKCNRFYEQAATLELHMEYRMYPDAASQRPMEVTKGEYVKGPKGYYSKINGLISVVDSKVSLTVDPTTRTMTLGAASTATFNPWGKITPEALQKIFTKTERVSDKDGLIHYRLIPIRTAGQNVNRMDVWFDRELFYIHRIAMYFDKVIIPTDNLGKETRSPRFEIQYSLVRREVTPDRLRNVTTSPYLKWNGEEAKPSGAYKDYAFINSYKR